MSTPQHTKILNRVAREVLKPIGVKRKGQSRTWLDDNDWWVTVIEFQPSSWSKGTFLNVGVNFQWYPKDYYSFDIGYREAGFVEYVSDEQFELTARKFVEIARNKVLQIRERLSTPESAKEYVIDSYKVLGLTLWGEYNQGVACLIASDEQQALVYLNQIVDDNYDTEWAKELRNFTIGLIKLVQSGQDYINFLNQVINKTREMKKLEKMENGLAKIA
jgi:hypothetical protein